jgi:acetyl-CoA synthetase
MIAQASSPKGSDTESILHEHRVFVPGKEFTDAAHIKSMAQYRKLYRESIDSPDAFWTRQAKNELIWFKPWKKVLDWKPPFAKWFVGGRLNACFNCLDRHLDTSIANKAAIIWEGEPDSVSKPGEERVITYRQLHREVCRFANVLRRNGIEKGDRVIIYLPMVPEAAIAMLACARLGAVHSVVFGGFSAHAVADRIQDCGAKAVITADGGYRRGSIVQLKRNVDDALALRDAQGELVAKSVKKVIVLRRGYNEIHIEEGCIETV